MPDKKRILTLLLAIVVMLLISSCSAADEAKISSASDLNQTGYIIGVPEGTPPEEVAKEYMPKAEISYFTQFVDGVAALKSGKATAAIYDSSGVDRILLSNPDLVKLPDRLGNIEVATVVRLNSTDLNDQINAFIKQLHADGTADEMVSRWIDNIGGVMPDIPKPQNPEKKLTFITNGMTEPMNYYENGVLTGYDIEFIKRFANYANIDYEIVTMDYSAMIPALQSGKGDIIVSDFFKTDERGQEVLYSDAYVVLHNSVMIRKTMYAGNAETIAGTITSNDELNGKRVGFITGMVYIDNFRPLYGADEYEYNDFSAMLEALKSNKIDAFLTSQSKVAEIVEQNPDLIALPPYADNSASIGVSKTNTELGDKLDVVVKRMIADGSLTALTEKWMGSDETAKVLTPVTLTGGNGTLVAGVLGDDYPYSYYKDNELVGLEVDLARILASQLGMNLEIKAMDFSAVIPSITSGKIDLAFYLAYTPERAESIRFLTPIKADSAVAIVQNKAYTGSTVAKTGFFASLQESFNKTFIVEDRYKLVLEGLWTTIVISLLSLLFGSILGALICAMRKSRFKIVSGLAIVYIRLIQGVPIVLNLMILYYIIFAAVDIDPILIAVVGFSINFAAYSAEIFRTAIDATDKGQLEAAYALGFTKISSFFKVTLPQALRHILPIFKGEFISMVKMTSVVGYIAIQDLTKMTDIIRSRTFDAFFPLFVTAFIYFVITYLFIFVLGKVEVQVDPKRRKRVVKGITDSENSVMEVLK